MLKRLFRIGLPAALLVCLGYYWGRQSAVSSAVDGKFQAGGESGLRSPLRKEAPRLTGADGLPAIFVGTADEFLKALYLEKGEQETQYLLFNTVQHSPLDRISSWAQELILMAPGRNWQPELLTAVGKRWGAADPTSAIDWAQSLQNAGHRRQAITVILAGVAREDPGTALAGLNALPEGPERDSAMVGIAEEILKIDPLQAIELLKGNTSSQSQSVMQEAFANLAQSDPQKAAEMALTLPPQSSDVAISSVFEAWALKDPTAALAAANKLPSRELRNHAISFAIEEWLTRDPTAALAQLKSIAPADLRALNLGRWLGALAQANPAQASAAFSDLPPWIQKLQVGSFISNYSLTDPEGALSWILTQTNKQLRKEALSSMGQGWVHLSPARRAAAIESIPPGSERNATLQSFIGSHSYSDPVVAAEMLLKLEPHLQARVLNNSGMMGGLARTDLDLTLKLSAQFSSQDGGISLAHALRRVAEVDFAKAEQYLATLPPGVQLKAMPEMYGALYSALATSDGPAAMAKVSAIEDPKTREQAMQSVVQSWAEQDPDALLEWSHTAPAKERAHAEANALYMKLKQDPIAILPAITSLVNSEPTDGDSSMASSLATEAVRRLCDHDPQVAAKWASELSNESIRDHAVVRIAEEWTHDDPLAASVWLRTLPEGKAKDAAVTQLVESIQLSDPSSAFAWASTIGGQESRQIAVTTAFQAWKRQDPAAAAQALQSAPLSDAERASILKR